MSEDESPYTGVKRADFARAKNEVIIREHEYDGIQEYDQKLPNWWLFTFYGAITWFVLHWCIYYYFKGIDTDQERVIAAAAEVQLRKQEKLAATLAELDDQTLIEIWATNLEIVARGQAVYSIHCVACHAADLSGKMVVGGQSIPLPGLAMDDGDWKYGKDPMAIFKLINEGTPPDSPGAQRRPDAGLGPDPHPPGGRRSDRIPHPQESSGLRGDRRRFHELMLTKPLPVRSGAALRFFFPESAVSQFFCRRQCPLLEKSRTER